MIPFIGGSILGMMPEILIYAAVGSGISNLDAMPVAAGAAAYIILTVISAAVLNKLAKKY